LMKLITITIFLSIILFYCKAQELKIDSTLTKSLNLDEIKQKIQDYAKDSKGEYLNFERDSVKISIHNSPTDKNDLGYTESNLKNGNNLYIRGNKEGYFKTIKNGNSFIVHEFSYYNDGKIKGIWALHSEIHLLRNEQNVEYPIGKAYRFDRNSNLIETLDYDKIYKFSINDVRKFLKSRKALNDRICIKSQVSDNLSGKIWYWEIYYFSSKYGLCYARIDAVSKKKIFDYRNMKTEE